MATPGNKAAVKSGAWSADLIAETAEELRPRLQQIIDQAPWITAVDVDGLEDYLRDRARLERLERWLATNGDRYSTGKRAGELRVQDMQLLNTLRRRCMDHRARLLLDPASRARARVDRRMLDLAALWAQLEDDEEGDEEVEA
jgi:hypothetical protein